MDTKKLEALAAAVEYGSFTRAAENLGYTQSGLTHMMNSLEKDIGFPVLLRGRQGVRLTLDADLQRACEGLATLYLPRGCIVVMDTATGEVLASVSMPSFDPQNIAASIAANDTSLLNRPLRAVGNSGYLVRYPDYPQFLILDTHPHHLAAKDTGRDEK